MSPMSPEASSVDVGPQDVNLLASAGNFTPHKVEAFRKPKRLKHYTAENTKETLKPDHEGFHPKLIAPSPKREPLAREPKLQALQA